MNKTLVIKEWLESGNTVTDMKAVMLCNSYRLSAIIYNLRHTYGLDVRDRWLVNENTGTKYKEYFIPKEIKNDN